MGAGSYSQQRHFDQWGLAESASKNRCVVAARPNGHFCKRTVLSTSQPSADNTKEMFDIIGEALANPLHGQSRGM